MAKDNGPKAAFTIRDVNENIADALRARAREEGEMREPWLRRLLIRVVDRREFIMTTEEAEKFDALVEAKHDPLDLLNLPSEADILEQIRLKRTAIVSGLLELGLLEYQLQEKRRVDALKQAAEEYEMLLRSAKK